MSTVRRRKVVSFAQIKANLLDLYGSVRPPVTDAAIEECQARLSVELPKDIRAAYALMNGADHWTDPETSWIRFWPVEEWESAKDWLLPAASTGEQDRLFVLADYGIECVHYAVDLKPMSSQFGSIYALGPTQAVQVAASFSGFIELVLCDSNELHSYS
jgi:cell wall assembly regulator SMI1